MQSAFLSLIFIFAYSFVSFAQNNCLDFDGISDYVSMGDVLDMGTSDFTIEAWIFVEGVETSNKVISKGLTSVGVPSNAGYGLRTSYFEADDISFTLGDSDGTFVRVISPGLIAGSWQHIVGVREGKDVRLYIDGVNVKSLTTATVYNVNNDVPFALGALHRGNLGATTELMDGKIDEVRIWGLARSQGEIQANMNTKLMGNEPGLLAYYRFDQGVPGGVNVNEITLIDNGPNGFDGGLSNFTLVGENSNWLGGTTSLPINLIDFNGEMNKNQVQLNWITASEIDNSGFEIERSNDGRNWNVIYFVTGRGTIDEEQVYQYQDLNPFVGMNYYRLKQIDFDGTFEYTGVVTIDYNNLEGGVLVFPNPSSGVFNLQVNNPLQKRIKISIFNNLGKLLWESNLMEGENTWRNQLRIDEGGVYFINTQIGEQFYSKRIIVSGEK